jgi:hypothetical protein
VSSETYHYLVHILKKLPDFEQFGFAAAIESYDWSFVDVPLVSLKDTTMRVQAEPIQLANRFGQTIEIDKTIWRQMNVFNQVATLLHEVVYASLTPLYRPDGTQFQDASAAIEIVGSIMNPKHQLQDASAARFKINGVSKISFLNLGSVYGLDTPALNSQDNFPSVTHNSDLVLRVPGVKDPENQAIELEEHHQITTEKDSPHLDFDVPAWCKAAIAAHWQKIEIINSRTNTTLGFKDYQDENQEYKKYFGVVQNDVYRGSTSQEPGSVGKLMISLPGKNINQCTNALSDALHRVAQSILDVLPKP